MDPDQLEVGAVYRLDGQMKFPKKILRREPGSRIMVCNVKPDDFQTQLSAPDRWHPDSFARRVVERLDLKNVTP